MSQALAGLRVLEMGGRATGLAGRILADLGAEVVLVEPPAGSAIRADAPFLDDLVNPERSFAHLYMNANKKSVTVALQDQFDRKTLVDLLASADVLLEAMPINWFDDHDLPFDDMLAINPRLVRCSITPFGLSTPWRHWQANDLVAGAAGGLIQVSGSPAGTPVQGGANPSYTMAGLAAASAISIALHQRDFNSPTTAQPTTTGIHIDISLQEATALAVMQTACPSLWQWHKKIPQRPGLSAAMACKDGKYVGLLVRPDRFKGFLEWADAVGIDHGMTQDDWQWARLEAPRQDNPVAATTLALAAALTRDEFVSGALGADIICLPVLDFPDLEQQEQYIVNDQFMTIPHEALAAQLGFVRSPVEAMADGVEIGRAPLLGEHQSLLDSLTGPAAGVMPSQLQDPAAALAGLRVIDFGWVLAAPIGTRILASFGAEVIRVESSTKPDSMRSQFGPDGKPDADLGGLFNSVNAGKKSLTLDLSQPAGLALIKELIATADIVVNNFRPGALERMGLGFDVLRELKPEIILLNLPGAHRKGPWAQRPSMGNILMAASGFNMLTGFPDERPRGIGVAYPDFTSPHLLVATILAAVRQRHLNGEGQQLHLTQLSGVLSLLGSEWMQFKATGQQPPRNANRNANFAPHGIYPCQPEGEMEAWVAIAVASDSQWLALCELMERPELAVDPRFAELSTRKQHEDELDSIVTDWVTQWTQSQDKWALADALQAIGVAAAPVENLRDMLERDPQLANHYQQVRQPAAPDVDIPIDREAARWVGTQLDLIRAPNLGEHNAEVVQGILGRSDEEFVQLMVDGVVS